LETARDPAAFDTFDITYGKEAFWSHLKQCHPAQRMVVALEEDEPLGKRHSFFEFSLCLSRACLGKMMHF
jgi:hypothetical protein